jgi:hypothetical protein
MLQSCHKQVTTMLQTCYKQLATMLQKCYEQVITRYKLVTNFLQCFYLIFYYKVLQQLHILNS